MKFEQTVFSDHRDTRCQEVRNTTIKHRASNPVSYGGSRHDTSENKDRCHVISILPNCNVGQDINQAARLQSQCES